MVLRGLLVVLGLIAVVAGQTCMPPFVPVSGKCLHVELSDQGSSMTWQEARDYCKALGGDLNADLASFPTCDEFTDFARYMAFNAGTNTSLWLGVHTQFSPNMWQWVTLEPLQTGVPFWYSNASYSDGFQCASSESDYYYRLVPADCQETRSFACSYIPVDAARKTPVKRVPTNCPNGGIIVGDFCYFFKDKTDSFEAADAQCRMDHGQEGGLLYYPENCDEFTAMAHHLEATADSNEYWVGAIDISGQQEWTWVSGNLVPGGPPYWSVGEPSHDHGNAPREHCATMARERRYYLVDDHCSDNFHYICKLTLA